MKYGGAVISESKAFIEANQALLPLIASIKLDQWDMKVPDEMSWQPNQTLRDIINYHTYDDAWVPDVLDGKTAEDVGKTYDEVLSTQDSIAEYQKYNARAIQAVKSFTDDTRVTHLSYGEFPASEYLSHITLFRGLRIYDIAKFIKADTTIPETLVAVLWKYVDSNQAWLRKNRVIGTAKTAPPNATTQQLLIATTGRG